MWFFWGKFFKLRTRAGQTFIRPTLNITLSSYITSHAPFSNAVSKVHTRIFQSLLFTDKKDYLEDLKDFYNDLEKVSMDYSTDAQAIQTAKL